MTGAFADQLVLPLTGIAILTDRRVERGVAAEPAVHVDDVLLGYAELLSDEFDLIGAHITLLQHRNLAR